MQPLRAQEAPGPLHWLTLTVWLAPSLVRLGQPVLQRLQLQSRPMQPLLHLRPTPDELQQRDSLLQIELATRRLLLVQLPPMLLIPRPNEHPPRCHGYGCFGLGWVTQLQQVR